MGKVSFILYNIYLLLLSIFLFAIATVHYDLICPLDRNKTWGFILYCVWNLSCLPFLFFKNTRQTPESFIRIRCLSIISLLLLAFCFISSSLDTVIQVPGIRVIVIIAIIILLIYQNISFWLHVGIFYRDFQLFHVKTARLSMIQWLLLFLFHTLLSVGCYGLFCIDANILEKDGLIDNLHFIRCVCIAINLLSMPMTYQFLLAWNSEKLKFVGIHPETKLRWRGVMKKMENGKWEVDQTPRDHDLCAV